jgi:hypothetical protein
MKAAGKSQPWYLHKKGLTERAGVELNASSNRASSTAPLAAAKHK